MYVCAGTFTESSVFVRNSAGFKRLSSIYSYVTQQNVKDTESYLPLRKGQTDHTAQLINRERSARVETNSTAREISERYIHASLS